MKTHQWILPVVTQARIDPAESPAGATRTLSPGRTARGILVLALVVGGLGAEAGAASGHSTGDHSSAHRSAGNIRLEASSHLTGSAHYNPWMY